MAKKRCKFCRCLFILTTRFDGLTVSSLYKLVRKYGLEALGKQISPHWFRHTYATHIRARNVDVKAVSMLLGHNSIQTTMNYDHSFQLQQGNYGDILVEEYDSL
ncbi:tyrosine-type recombinase/integrase [Desulfonatronovibrio magnus]|uniref:tyrosine-type recombinase/integrase n=1 Tax=Desulfonatronovibrio magnus TaxID=698827 RepID=UPI0005EBCE81|nr:site-specific integrase [Desulfonatronovibrio magnus]